MSDQPGIKCTLCGNTIRMPGRDNPNYPNMYPSWEYKKHDNLEDCVKYLAQRVKDLESDVFDLNNPHYHD